MAAGILAIGFVFIAGMFPVGVKLTALSTEQTIAPIVADEAIAKIKLYGKLYNELDNEPNLVDELEIAAGLGNGYVDLADALPGIPNGEPCEIDEFAYPSAEINPEPKKYHWSALCGLLSDGNVHVTVFVSRKAGAGARYRAPNSDYTQADYGQVASEPVDGDWPVPVKVGIQEVAPRRLRIIEIDEDSEERLYINDGSKIVDDTWPWQIYRVLERYASAPDEIMLDEEWEGLATGHVWVVPPAVGSGRNPCIAVYQTVIGF